MNWILLQDEKQLNEIVSNSNNVPQVIFKHSTRCGISSMTKSKLDKKEAPKGINFYLLDLIRFRSISDKIATDFGISHQSPQVLVINKGKCIFNESHYGISFDDIQAAIMQE